MISGNPIKLLMFMAQNDCGIARAAEALHLSKTAADKQIAKARDYFGANTTHGALLEAIRQGYIPPDK